MTYVDNAWILPMWIMGVFAVLRVHSAWMLGWLSAIDKRTAHLDIESIADGTSADSSAAISAQRPLAQERHDPFVELIRHLEGGRRADT